MAQIEDTEEHQQFFGYDTFPDVLRSVQVTRPGQMTVNFIVLDTSHPFNHVDVAERCDFGICQIAMRPDGSLYKSPAFIHDYRQYTFTYLRDPFDPLQFERSKRRYERLTDEKYEGWLLHVPGMPLSGTRADTLILDEIGI
ncbi:hypothetical protein [Mesorhizobium sp.]|uniref:hypothetical protein n=1 Tax=Mesorhizobium sp. TaxID=1871066 RepID=UPI000FE65BB3|nr:hypothetical protein [Mesorhizobium sp.]RWM84326.1 MAG: hypothetical protein EOR83_17040 [Mesorhizobium sp.]